MGDDGGASGDAASTHVGFASARAGNPRVPGAACALRFAPGEAPRFDPPRPASTRRSASPESAAPPVEGKPRKPLQDDLDAVTCLLVAARRGTERVRRVMIGDLRHGYIVAPACPALRERLARSRGTAQVPVR